MKDIKTFILEASILADIDDQLEYGEEALKTVIINWLKENVKSIKEDKLKFDFNTAPITVNYSGDIKFNDNITSLTNETFQWCEVSGTFNCGNCHSLKSLEGAPKEVGRDFYCYNCHSLKSLEGAPKEVGWSFNCRQCHSLKSLEGAPKEVGWSFNCRQCHSLKSLEGAPKEVGRDFDCSECGVKFTKEDVKKVTNVKKGIYC